MAAVEVLPLGARWPGGDPLFGTPQESDLWGRLDLVAKDARQIDVAPWTFDEREVVRAPRLDEPTEAGWSFVVAQDDPDRDQVVAVMEPLAVYRRMSDPSSPLTYPSGDVGDWVEHSYRGLGITRPWYLLLVGNPSRLPYELQVDLAAAGAMVGRVCFQGERRLDDLAAYVAKVCAFEKAADPVPKATATVVATDGGPFDATTYSIKHLVPPIVEALTDEARLQVSTLTGAAATKSAVSQALRSGTPAIVFTATHGAGVPNGQSETQQRGINGAWGCAPSVSSRPNAWDWLTADELPTGSLAPGGAVFQFACFGAGTSTSSSFARWLGGTHEFDALTAFVAAIPQRLLANPDGPVAFVSHVDLALAHGFIDPARRRQGHNPRIEPFLSAVRSIAGHLQPVGFALRDLHARSAGLSSKIARALDKLEQRGIRVDDLPADERAKLVDTVILRNDAMHYLLLGDPAARIRVGT